MLLHGRIAGVTAGITISLLTCIVEAQTNATGPHWPSFRGANAGGVSDGMALPVVWDGPSSKNIAWETPIPGLAHSSPIVWGNRLYVTSAESSQADPYLKIGLFGASPDHPENFEHEFVTYCLDKNNGEILWRQVAHKGVPKVKRHIKASHANCTPATDGQHVVSFFGSNGIYCYDMDGQLLWKKDLGYLDMGPANAKSLQWGFSSSPVIHDNMVILQCAARNVSFVTALNIKDGSEVWRTSREVYPGWGTPTVLADKRFPQVIANGFKHIGAYDLNTGKSLWHLHGGGDVPVPTPIFANDLIYITSAHGGQAPVYAIRASAKGDINLTDGKTSNEHIAWSHMKIGNYMQTPLVYGPHLYCCRDSGILACYDAKTGKKQYRKRLASGVGFTSSPVAGDNKIYFTSEEGDVFVIKTGSDYELLAKNTLGEICMSSPAISEGRLYFRTQHHVMAVGK